ncbi:hypothetical protein ES703_89755 [subsurface metagenome]
MLFTTDVTVPKNRTETDPVVAILKIALGIITHISVLFPPGCAGLAHCTIHHYSKQIVPSVESMDLKGDMFPIEWNDYYEMYAEPYLLKFTGWNLDDTYPHTIYIRIAILPRKAILALAIVDAFKSLFGLLSPKRIFTGRS